MSGRVKHITVQYVDWSLGISLVIMRKSESKNGGNKKTKHVKLSENQKFLTL